MLAIRSFKHHNIRGMLAWLACEASPSISFILRCMLCSGTSYSLYTLFLMYWYFIVFFKFHINLLLSLRWYNWEIYAFAAYRLSQTFRHKNKLFVCWRSFHLMILLRHLINETNSGHSLLLAVCTLSDKALRH